MPESGTSGSVRGVPSNGHSYRDNVIEAANVNVHAILVKLASGQLTFSRVM
jgi:hypothetical protein